MAWIQRTRKALIDLKKNDKSKKWDAQSQKKEVCPICSKKSAEHIKPQKKIFHRPKGYGNPCAISQGWRYSRLNLSRLDCGRWCKGSEEINGSKYHRTRYLKIGFLAYLWISGEIRYLKGPIGYWKKVTIRKEACIVHVGTVIHNYQGEGAS